MAKEYSSTMDARFSLILMKQEKLIEDLTALNIELTELLSQHIDVTEYENRLKLITGGQYNGPDSSALSSGNTHDV